jgi:hypothetical protein
MKVFFEKYPDILCDCKLVNKRINNNIKSYKININEISIDNLIPFLFFEIPEDCKKEMSFALRIYREIIDCYNKTSNKASEFKVLLNDFYPFKIISNNDFIKINLKYRKLINDDIIKSYMLSVERVFYRKEILIYFSTIYKYKLPLHFFKTIDILSAFFLYDDDICDLEYDLKAGKTTILTNYVLNSNGDIKCSNDLFVDRLNNIIKKYNQNSKLCLFINIFKSLYQ